MVNKIPYQFRYGTNEGEYSEKDFLEGNLFKNYNAITQLGIQTTPGVNFSLNNSSSKIEVGDTGIYELDLTGKGIITSIKFYKDKPWGNPAEAGTSFSLIVDILSDAKQDDKREEDI